jgi:hypothetical protein
MKTLCLQQLRKKNNNKKNPALLVFPHDCGTIAASTRSCTLASGKIPGSLVFA